MDVGIEALSSLISNDTGEELVHWSVSESELEKVLKLKIYY